MPLKPVLHVLLGLCLAVSVVTDLRRRRLYVHLSLGALLLSLGLRLAFEGVGEEPELGLFSGALGAASSLAVFGAFAWMSKGLGWEEVLLVTAVGGILGYPLSLAALMFISLAGAAQAIASVLWKREAFANFRAMFAGRRPVERAAAPGIPYGVAIAVGSLWAVWWEYAVN